MYQTVGSIKGEDIHATGHIFAIEEIPGFYERYPTEETRRFTVLSDMKR